jgi:hypothetical protein
MTDIDLTAAQMEIEKLTHKNHAMTRLKNEFRSDSVIEYIKSHEIPVDFCFDLMAQMVLHRRASISVLVGLLHKHFEKGNIQDSLQECADMIVKAGEAGLIDWDMISHTAYISEDVSEEVKVELSKYQYPMPMLVEPKEVKENRDSGYLTTKSSIILKHNHTEDDVCLDHINRMNRVPLTINHQTSWMVDNHWEGLDHKKDDETVEDYALRVQAFRKYTATSYDIMEHLAVADDRFYLTNKYDKRGRTYSQGYHVNPQGADWNKSVIELADKELIAA